MADNAPIHWADQYAQRVIRERGPIELGVKEHFTCAAGITPSGTVHIGNFREIISVELIVRALRDAGMPVRFMYSWDDFDVFRKVPANMPNGELLTQHLRRPITEVPDPWGVESSYARANERRLEIELPKVGVEPEYLYQAARYAEGRYAEGMRVALERRETIRSILNEHRTTPLGDDWWPISIFSAFSGHDTTTVLSWDGAYGVTYRCDETQKTETIDLRTCTRVKLFWRIDWPMRWKAEGVDFEPAGKEHHSAGGSFDTAKRVVAEVYDGHPPVTFKYDFISIKGMGGKISSSAGNVISLTEVLEVYQPEIVRYLFAGTRPNAEFAISFDLDVIKIYEDYDRCERIAYGVEEVGEKRRAKERRTYELSQLVPQPSDSMPPQVPFRHLCNLLLVSAGDIDAALAAMPGIGGGYAERLPADHVRRLLDRARCAWNWLHGYAPEEFRFSVRTPEDPPPDLSPVERRALLLLADALADVSGESAVCASTADRETDAAEGAGGSEPDEKELANRIYRVAEEAGLDAPALFAAAYKALIGREKGPRLAGFLITLGIERARVLLRAAAGEEPARESRG